MQNAHIAVAKLGRVHRLEHGGDSLHRVHRQHAAAIQTAAVGDGGFLAGSIPLGAVVHIGAALQHIAGDGVQGQTRLMTHRPGGFQHIVVNGSQIQHIGQAHIVAILAHLCLHIYHAHLAPIGGHAFGQRLGGLGQSGVAAELNALAAVFGDGALLTELIVNQVGSSLLQQRPVIKGLVFCGQTGIGGDVDVFCKQLKIHVDFHLMFSFYHMI